MSSSFTKVTLTRLGAHTSARSTGEQQLVHDQSEVPREGGVGLARDGDTIGLDIPNGTLQLWVDEQELDRRRDHWQQPPTQHTRGVLAKYARLVGSASGGAVCN